MTSVGIALMAMAPLAAQGCFWTYPRNLPIVETNARYWIGEVVLSPGERVTIDGHFPHARQMSFNIHRRSDNAVIASMTDLDITPESGSVNPFRPGARRDAAQRRYSVAVAADDGDRPVPNTVSLKIPAGGDALALRILYRMYLPDRAHPGGGSPLPVVWKVAADGSRSSMGGDCPDPAGVSPEQTIGQTRIPPAAGVVRDPIEWMVSGATDGKASGDMLVNRDNAYAYALTDFRLGEVLVLRGRAPLAPRTFDGTPMMTDGQVRYWSLCTYRHPSDRSAACVADEQIITDAGRNYAVVISAAADRPSNALPECGVTWLDALTEGEGAILLRHLAPSPSFVDSPIDVTEAGPAGPTLGPYEPVGRYMTRGAFEASGCSPRVVTGG